MNPSVKNIVTMFLEYNGFGGLFNVNGQCGCGLDDLEPCGEMASICFAGYRNRCETCICVTQRKTTKHECPYDLADEDNRTVTTVTKCWRGA